MSARRLPVSRSPNGTAADLYIDGDNDELILHNYQDERVVKKILDRNKALAANNYRGNSAGVVIGSVPMGLYMEWQREYRNHADKWTFDTYIEMKLRQYEYSYLRPTSMRI